MIKTLLIYTLTMITLAAVPTQAHATEIGLMDAPERELQQINIYMDNGRLRITGALGQKLYIYNVIGKPVSITKIDSNDYHIDLPLSKGCYIVQVGKVVRKIAVN